MRLPTTLKALKYVAQGESFSRARQIVKDRRLAKSLQAQGPVSDPVAIAAQIASDEVLAHKMAVADHDPNLLTQAALMKMGAATAALRTATSPGDVSMLKRMQADGLGVATRQHAYYANLARRPKLVSPSLISITDAWEKAIAQQKAWRKADQKQNLAALQRDREAYCPIRGPKLQYRTFHFTLGTAPPLSLSRRSSASSVASTPSTLSTPSEAAATSFWSADALQPKLVRSGSDPDVGGFRPMIQRLDSADV